MLVEPAWPELPDARLYPDKPQGITRDDGHWVLGHKEFRYAVVPEQAGELVLPELRVDWWDTRENRQRTAVLPAHTVQVQPSGLVPPPAVAPGPAVSAPAPGSAPGPSAAESSRLWPALAAGFATLWLLTLWLWRRAVHGQPGEARLKTTLDDGADAFLAQLKQACQAGDRAAARRGLRGWLRVHGTATDASLLDFAATVDDAELRAAIYALDGAGFLRSGADDWDGRSFWRHFSGWRNRQASAFGENVSLTDLYARAGS